jgi:translation initiation factor 2B subunit (eIF-2B alpha/beta/delta family)
MELFIKKVISGGQTGADRAGLEAAKRTGIETGGFCPKRYLTEDGYDRKLKSFGLIPTKTEDYTERTVLNVKHSDGTVIFSRTDDDGNATGIGTILTINTAKDAEKPYIINPNDKDFLHWVLNNNIRTLNVAGNRKSQNKNIYDEVYDFLSKNLLIPENVSGTDLNEYNKFYKGEIEIKNNQVSGSITLLNKLITVIEEYIKEATVHSSFVYYNIKRNAGIFKEGNTGYMIVLSRFTDGFIQTFENISTEKDERGKFLEYIANYRKQWTDVNKMIAANVFREIKFKDKTVLLFSNSSTVTALFQAMAKRKVFPMLLQCESVPGKEGLIQAKNLRMMGYKVRVIKDDEIGKHIKKIDFTVLGCDGYNDMLFVNKTGTFNLVKKLNLSYKPVYVLSESRKYTKGGLKYANICEDTLFEQIPLKRITKMITEKPSPKN